MLERENIHSGERRPSPDSAPRHSESSIEDTVLSLSHRIALLEQSLSSKIDRAECMLILETKASHSQVKKTADELHLKLERSQKLAEERMAEQQKQAISAIEKCREKLAAKKKQARKSADKINILLKPQQLYLESSQTMFSMVVDEISALKEAQQLFERNLEQRQRVVVSLNNQVCEKIERLERELEGYKFGKQPRKGGALNESGQSWSNYEESEDHNKESRPILHKQVQPSSMTGGLEEHRINHLMRNIQGLQKQLSSKINIRDILPLLKKNIAPIAQSVEEIKNYTQEAIESTKKILFNQSEINQQLSLVCRVGWWHSFEQRNGLAIWNKEIVNLVPETFLYSKNSNEVIVAQQGNYLLRLLSPHNEVPEAIMVGGQEVELLGETLIKIDKNAAIQIPSDGNQLLLCVQKL